MANAHILFDPPSDAGTYSGGSWQRGLGSLKTTFPTEVARSTNLAATSTTFTVDLLFTRPLSMFALIANSFSTTATIRIRVSDAANMAGPSLDVTIPAFRPNVAWGSMPWGAFPWDGFREDYQPGGATTFYKHAETVFGRYVRIDIADPANAAGYVQIGRFMAGDAFVPKINMAYGAALKFIDESAKSLSKGGQAWWDRKAKRRQITAQFPFLSEGEAYGAAYDLLNKLGLTGNLLFVYDPDDASAIVLRRTIYGGLAQLDDIVSASPSIDYPYSWNLAIEELL
ncbi:MAG: hypothetical protein WAP03_10175 [Methylorubrum rhodinum]|uniref:hypothetical protein n=1 Tax=Methylorubrum rhodinum TaxID=29428 RepID=UPI003BAE8CD8